MASLQVVCLQVVQQRTGLCLSGAKVIRIAFVLVALLRETTHVPASECQESCCISEIKHTRHVGLITTPDSVHSTCCMGRLKKLVENGPHPPPGETGARFIIRDDGARLDLRYLKKESDRHLEFGYKVSFSCICICMCIFMCICARYQGVIHSQSQSTDRKSVV